MRIRLSYTSTILNILKFSIIPIQFEFWKDVVVVIFLLGRLFYFHDIYQ